MNTKAIVLAVGLALAPMWAQATVINIPNPTSPVSYGDGTLTYAPPAINFWYSANEPPNQGTDVVNAWVENIVGEEIEQMFKCVGGSCTTGGDKSGGNGQTELVTITSSMGPFDFLYIHSGQGGKSVYSWLFEFAQPVNTFTFSGLPKGYSNAFTFEKEGEEVPEPAPLVIMAAPLALLFRKMWS